MDIIIVFMGSNEQRKALSLPSVFKA